MSLVDLTVTGNTILGDSCVDDTLTITAVTTINCETNFLDSSTMWNQEEMRFSAEATPSGAATYMAFRAPAAVTATTTLTLPDGDGTSGQVLSTDGSGNLSWANGVGGDATFDNLTINGNTILGDDCATDTLTINSETSVNCNITLGNDSTNTVAFNGLVSTDVLPDTDDSHDLGSPTQRWANIYTGDLHLANDRGDWTVIEEETYLSLRNNKSGKIFKIVMEEI